MIFVTPFLFVETYILYESYKGVVKSINLEVRMSSMFLNKPFTVIWDVGLTMYNNWTEIE